MKASDVGLFMMGQAADPLQSMISATTAHNFERAVLDHCHGNSMDRVVTALDYGSTQIIHEGVREVIFFLVFEYAQGGDLRRRVQQAAQLDMLWVYTTLHNVAVALSQLHSGQIFHNDLKPANTLVFSDDLQKIADLGRATTPHFAAAHDGNLCAGDRRFAAPEQLYSQELEGVVLERFPRFRAGDLYGLGSLAHYLMTSRMVTPEVIGRMRAEYRPRVPNGGWQDSYRLALPYWRAAFTEVMQELSNEIREDWPAEIQPEALAIAEMATQLCDPDPMTRGHPRDQGAGQFNLQRYVTMLDLGRQKLLIRRPNAN